MTTPKVLDLPDATQQELHIAPQRTLGEQQEKMALAALGPRAKRVRFTGLARAWVVGHARPVHEGAAFGEAGVKSSGRDVERTLRCPYCRSLTYQVRVRVRPSGLEASGACSLCGTQGVSFRPARIYRPLRRQPKNPVAGSSA
jgi:hypothetical protein